MPAGELDLGEIAERTPGFVVADLAALVREAALRAAARASETGETPALTQEDLTGALGVIRPLSRSATEEVSVGSVTLEDVGDMVDDQAGADRGRAVAAAASRDIPAPRRGAAAWRAALRASRVRQDVRGPCAGQLGPAQRARRQRRRADGQVGRLVGEGGPRIVPSRTRFRAIAGVPRRDRRAGPAARAEFRLRGDRPRGGRDADRTRRHRAAARRGRARARRTART